MGRIVSVLLVVVCLSVCVRPEDMSSRALDTKSDEGMLKRLERAEESLSRSLRIAEMRLLIVGDPNAKEGSEVIEGVRYVIVKTNRNQGVPLLEAEFSELKGEKPPYIRTVWFVVEHGNIEAADYFSISDSEHKHVKLTVAGDPLLKLDKLRVAIRVIVAYSDRIEK